MRKAFLLLLLLFLPAASAPARTDLVIVAWNVENLFDADDDPGNPGDDEFTPAGWRRWNEARYRLKLERLAEVIAELRPDILGLAEVENRRVLEDLGQLLAGKHGLVLPAIIHRDCADMRGIDNAIMAVCAPVAVEWLRPVDIQREIIVADFELEGARLTVMMNHWKAHGGRKLESAALRATEARAARAELDRRLADDPAAAIVLLGDFNDDVDGAFLTGCAGCVLDETAVLADGRLLFNLAATLPPAERGTYYYAQARRWNNFDSISVSRGLLAKGVPPSPWVVKRSSYRVHAPGRMRMENTGAPLPFRHIRSGGQSRFAAGYADHFPVVAVVELRP